MSSSNTAFTSLSIPRVGRMCMPHYEALFEQMERTGWPTLFKSDVTVHDQATLAKRAPSEPFAWMLHSSGTYLVFPDPSPIDGAGHYAHDMPAFVESSFGKDTLWFWWDGERLHAMHCAACLADRLKVASGRQ